MGMRARFRLATGGRIAYTTHVHQIVFNEISAAELSVIPSSVQLELFEAFQVDEEFLSGAKEDTRFGVVERNGRRIFRYRTHDYRVYFTMEDGAVVVQRVLHADSVADFLFRSGMGGSEDQKLGQSRSFWSLIDAGEKAARK